MQECNYYHYNIIKMNLDIFSKDFVSQLIIMGLSAVLLWSGWIIKKGIDSYNTKKQKKQKEDYLSSLKAVANVYKSMSNINDLLEVNRVFLLEVSNGGHRPKPGGVIYAKSIEIKVDFDSPNNTRDDLLAKYEKVRVDESYIRMILQAQMTEKPYTFLVDKHDPCILKSFYLSEGVKYSEIYHIYTDPTVEKMFILSISTTKENETFKNEVTKAVIESEINHLIYNFTVYRET